MKKLFTLLFTLVTILNTSAQGVSTPFTRTPRNAKGQYEYKDYSPRTSALGISVGYGIMPMMANTKWAGNTFNHYGTSFKNLTSETTSNIGTFTIGINYFINPWLELQFPVSLSISDGYLRYQGSNYDRPFKEIYGSFTPNVKVSWMYSKYVNLYSRVGIGFILCNRHDEYVTINNSVINSRFALSWQVSPIGIEVGRAVTFFAEAGFGTIGFVQAGLKVRFKKSTKDHSKYRTMDALGTKSSEYRRLYISPSEVRMEPYMDIQKITL